MVNLNTPFILKRLVKKITLFIPCKICLGDVLLISKGIWMITYISSILFTTMSIQMAPYEDRQGRRCRTYIGWFKVGEAGLKEPYLFHQ